MIRNISWSGLLLTCLLFSCPASAQTGVHCGTDLKRIHGVKLPHAVLYSHQTQEEMAQPTQKMCETTYVISGRHARAAEAMLMHRYGMGKLVFECCGWFPEKGKTGYFRRSHRMADGSEAIYVISLSSEETAEKDWQKISRFYVTLTIYAI